MGNTNRVRKEVKVDRDHPHMCGEYLVTTGIICSGRGSPPHVWGILVISHNFLLLSRITPTCVGNTKKISTTGHVSRDHPHMCGEYILQRDVGHGEKGSPPHVWGIRKHSPLFRSPSRITPTCVGNTLKDPSIGAIPK